MHIPQQYCERYNRLARSHPWMREMRDEQAPEGDVVAILRKWANFWGVSHSTHTQCDSNWEKTTMLALADMIERDYVSRKMYDSERKSLLDKIVAADDAFIELKRRRCPHYHTDEHYCDVHETRFKKLYEQVRELTAERDEWKAKAETIGDSIAQSNITQEEGASLSELSGNLSDSREKLEAEIRNIVHCIGIYTRQKLLQNDFNYNTLDDYVPLLSELLDRQAAITEREHPGLTISDDESLINWHGKNYLLQSRVLNAERERDEFSLKLKHEMELNRDNRNAHDLELIDELIAERDKLQAQLSQLQGDLKGTRKSRDSWYEVAVRQSGKLVKLRRQLKAERELARMWPRFEDGAIVKFGDEIEWSDNGELKAAKVSEIKFERYFNREVRSAIRVNNYTHITRAIGESYKRPPLKAADGQLIEIGQTLYGGDGTPWVISGFFHGDKHPIEGCTPDENGIDIVKQLKPEWLTHEKPDSWERIVDDIRQDVEDHMAFTTRATLSKWADRIEKIAKEAGR